ncbi:MAG: hypothetical protein ACKV2T_24600 [Kofleriaceae bacterium]
MSPRDEIIDKLADNIDFDTAKLLGMRAGVAARFFGDEKNAQARFALILERLERSHAQTAFARLFDVVRKDHPRTVVECEAILRASPDLGLVRSARASRPVRVVVNGAPVTTLVGRGSHDFTVQIGAYTRDEPPPELEIVGEQPSDKIDRSAATLERTARPEWWEIGISFTRDGLRSRTLSLRVIDETADVESTTLKLVDRTALLAGRIYFAFATLFCAATIAIAFGSYAGSLAPLLSLLFPLGALAAGIATLRPRFARFGTPPYLFGVGSLVLALASLPGQLVVAVENQTDGPVTIGTRIEKGTWVTMPASRADAAASAYCMTAASRGGGLSAFLPWRTVKKASPRWTVVENTFAPEVLAEKLVVEGGTRADRTVIVRVDPPDCAASSARASLRDYLAARIQIPYGWTLSSFTEGNKELLRLVHTFGAPRVDFATQLVVTDRGALSCESGSPIILEPLPEIPEAKNLEVTTEGEDGTASHWRSTSPTSWRCRVSKTRVNHIVLSTTSSDFDLPAEMGAARLTIGGQKIDVPADARKIKRRTLAIEGSTNIPRGAIDLDSGGKAVIDGGHVLMALKRDDEKQTFGKNGEDFQLELLDKTKPVKIGKLPPGIRPRMLRLQPIEPRTQPIDPRVLDPRVQPTIPTTPTTPTGPSGTETPSATPHRIDTRTIPHVDPRVRDRIRLQPTTPSPAPVPVRPP